MKKIKILALSILLFSLVAGPSQASSIGEDGTSQTNYSSTCAFGSSSFDYDCGDYWEVTDPDTDETTYVAIVCDDEGFVEEIYYMGYIYPGDIFDIDTNTGELICLDNYVISLGEDGYAECSKTDSIEKSLDIVDQLPGGNAVLAGGPFCALNTHHNLKATTSTITGMIAVMLGLMALFFGFRKKQVNA